MEDDTKPATHLHKKRHKLLVNNAIFSVNRYILYVQDTLNYEEQVFSELTIVRFKQQKCYCVRNNLTWLRNWKIQHTLIYSTSKPSTPTSQSKRLSNLGWR